MRGTYEAYILVKIKDGTQFVCALNRQKPRNTRDDGQGDSLSDWGVRVDLQEQQVIWN